MSTSRTEIAQLGWGSRVVQGRITPHGTISVQFKTDELLTSGVFQSAFSDHGGGVTETSEGKVEITEADVPDLQKEPYPDQE